MNAVGDGGEHGDTAQSQQANSPGSLPKMKADSHQGKAQKQQAQHAVQNNAVGFHWLIPLSKTKGPNTIPNYWGRRLAFGFGCRAQKLRRGGFAADFAAQ